MKKLLKNLWNFIASIKLTLYLLAAIGFTILLQIIIGSEMIPILGGWKWLYSIKSTNIYRSWWFILLLILFSLNLITCSIRRFPQTLKLLTQLPRDIDENLISSLILKKKFKVEKESELKQRISTLLTSLFKSPNLISQNPHHHILYAEKGRYTPLGFYLAHLSILIVIVGAVFSTSGYEYSFDMIKGKTLEPVVIRDASGRKKKLNFSLNCDDFEVIYYPGTSIPKTYKSTITILRNGEKVKTEEVDFSHPLKYEGISFYQTRYRRDIKRAKIGMSFKSGKMEIHHVRPRSIFKLNESNYTIRTIQIDPEAVELEVLLDDSSPTKTWVYTTPSQFPQGILEDYQFTLLGFSEKVITRLKAIRDPGKWWLWSGFICMLIGFGITFFTSNIKIWIKIDEIEDAHLITLAGSTNKNQGSFKRKFEKLSWEIKGFCNVKELL